MGVVMPNPIRGWKYREARTLWLKGLRGQPVPCCLCGLPVDTSADGRLPWGPTIEHTLPIRTIEAMARDHAHAVALACDTSMWQVAHRRCQDSQGAKVTNAKRRTQTRGQVIGASREW